MKPQIATSLRSTAGDAFTHSVPPQETHCAFGERAITVYSVVTWYTTVQ